MSDQVRLTAAPSTSLASTKAPVQGAEQTQISQRCYGKAIGPTVAEGCKTTVSQLQSQARLLMYKPCSQCRRCSCTRNTQNLTTTERAANRLPRPAVYQLHHACPAYGPPEARQICCPRRQVQRAIGQQQAGVTAGAMPAAAVSGCVDVPAIKACRGYFESPESASARHAVPQKDMLEVHMYMLCLLGVAEQRPGARSRFPRAER